MDIFYALAGRISHIYLADAVVEVVFVIGVIVLAISDARSRRTG